MNATKTLSLGAVLVLVAGLVACGGTSYNANPMTPTPTAPSTPSPVTAADVTIVITGVNGSLSYSPAAANVKVGQTVAWRNADSIVHTATSNTAAFDTGNIAPGGTSAPITMGAAGVIGYHCNLHPSMVGSLNVTQ